MTLVRVDTSSGRKKKLKYEKNEVETFIINEYYRRSVSYTKLNDTLFLGIAMNVFKDDLKLDVGESIDFEINFFVFDCANVILFLFESPKLLYESDVLNGHNKIASSINQCIVLVLLPFLWVKT